MPAIGCPMLRDTRFARDRGQGSISRPITKKLAASMNSAQEADSPSPVDDLEIVAPMGVVPRELPPANYGVTAVSEAACEPLREPWRIAPQSPRLGVDVRLKESEHTS